MKNFFSIKHLGLFLLVLVFGLLMSCSNQQSPKDKPPTPLSFSVEIQVNSAEETHASFAVTNIGDSVFSEVDNFKGEANLWNSDATLRAKIKSSSIRAIQPEETVYHTSASWQLDPGIYFLTWGDPEYGGVITNFSIVENNERLYLGKTQTFNTEPTLYGNDIDHAGSVRSFTLDEDGTVMIQGETALPDDGCVMPLLFNNEGVVPGFPIGMCAEITDGQWQMQVPPDTSGSGITIEPDHNYNVVLFSDDMTIPPSKPFVVEISAPPK